MNMKPENRTFNTDHAKEMKHYYHKVFTLSSIMQKINQLCSFHRIEKLYLSLFCSRRKQVHPFHFMSSSLLNSIELAALFTTHSHFAGSIDYFPVEIKGL